MMWVFALFGVTFAVLGVLLIGAVGMINATLQSLYALGQAQETRFASQHVNDKALAAARARSSEELIMEQNRLLKETHIIGREQLAAAEAWRAKELRHMDICEKRYLARLSGNETEAVRH